MPVRRWSRQLQNISQAPKVEESEFTVQGPGGGTALPELAMPRDSQLLPAASRALLRAARAGCIYVRQSGRATKEEEKDTTTTEDQTNIADRSFTSRKWATLPKHIDPPEVEYLAKRRPGLPSLYGGPAGLDGSSGVGPAPMRRTKFKKLDPATGNISIYEAWVPEGHAIEGEVVGDIQTIVEQSEVPVKPEAPAPGTVVEGVGIVNSEGVVVAEASSAAVVNPNKRRPPMPKRKNKGVGKGRKKKVMFAPGEGADAATVHGVTPGAEGDGAKLGQDGLPMPIDQSGQDDDDEDGEDGDESEGDDGDESMIDAKTPETPVQQSVDESNEQQPEPASTSADQEPSKDIEMEDALPDAQPPVSEPPTKAPSPPVPAVSQDETSGHETEAAASSTPVPPTEETQEPGTETKEPIEASKETSPPKEALEVAAQPDGIAKEGEETAPKEEALDTPSTSLPHAEEAETTDSQPAKPEEITPALPSASPEEKPSEPTPLEELPAQTEPENIVEDAPQPPTKDLSSGQPEALPNAQEENDAAGAEIPEVSQGPVEEQKDTDMGDASNPADQQVALEENLASPARPPLMTEPEPTVEAAEAAAPEIAAPQITAPETTASEPAAPEPSAPEPSVPEPPAPSVPEHEHEPTEPEAKTEETPVSAPTEAETAQTEEPESETRKEESDSTPAPAVDAA